MTAPALGIDPGREGGSGLLDSDGRTALATWSWSPSGEGYLVWRWRADAPRTSPSLWRARLCGVGALIAADVREVLGEAPELVLCAEGLFVHPKRVHGVIELAEATGELLGPIRELTDAEPLRPRAAVWRPEILGIAPNTPADRAEAVAVHAVRLGLVRGLPELVDGHVAEGLCMARWGWVQARQGAQLELVGRGR